VEKEDAMSFLKESFPGNFPAWDKDDNEFPLNLWRQNFFLILAHPVCKM
jgi:hypothetical protein